MAGISETISNLLHQTAFLNLSWGNYLMILVAFVFLFLAIKHGFEPLLLIPIAFGMLLVNIYPDIMMAPSTDAAGIEHAGGLLWYFFKLDEWSVLPSLIFLGVGAMTDFGPLIANPISFLMGAAAQVGIYCAYFLAIFMGFNGKAAAAISIIGGAQIVSDFTREDQSRAENIHFDTNARPSRGFLRDLLQRGLFSAALPPGSEASTFCANEGALLSERKRTVGVGFAAQNGVDIVEKGTAISYALDLLPSFTNPKETEGYQYQVEYLIGGQAKDADNLETVLQRILLIREAANYFFLAKDPQKRAESYALASALCTALLIPAAAPAVAMGIRAAWAYLESISDVRALLEGKRVPMLKSAMTWKTSPNAFASASAEEAVQNGAGKDNGGKDGGGEQGSGSAYTDYLAMLLIPMDAEQLMLRMCTMMEQTMRNAYDRDGFSLDRLVTEVRAEFKGKIDQKELFCSRYYHYGKRSTA